MVKMMNRRDILKSLCCLPFCGIKLKKQNDKIDEIILSLLNKQPSPLEYKCVYGQIIEDKHSVYTILHFAKLEWIMPNGDVKYPPYRQFLNDNKTVIAIQTNISSSKYNYLAKQVECTWGIHCQIHLINNDFPYLCRQEYECDYGSDTII